MEPSSNGDGTSETPKSCSEIKKRAKHKKKRKENGRSSGMKRRGQDDVQNCVGEKHRKKSKKEMKEEKNKEKKKKKKHPKREKKQGNKKESKARNSADESPKDVFKNFEKGSEEDTYKIVESSALDFVPDSSSPHEKKNDVSLLLFYQYVEPPWDAQFYNRTVLKHMQNIGTELQLTGRMRVSREGLNCTLTGTHDSIIKYCQALRAFHKGEFAETEFKITTDLPKAQRFPSLKVMPVTELVHYGLEGEKAPPIDYTGVHLEPKQYHEKLAEKETVVIDVRNHYEAAIGHFDPPEKGAKWLDPLMRKSTEFPVWLDKPETKEQLRGKQVLMYCTGGVRCERASALLKYKMETESDVKNLGIKGVYQLQGGIDKYFKEIPDGGFWKGKNFVFDKRFAHAPPKVEAEGMSDKNGEKRTMGKCESCGKPWDMYKGKRRCPTCGVPSLICRDCFQADRDGTRKIDRKVRCDLCVEQNITSKAQIREREQKELKAYNTSKNTSAQNNWGKFKVAPNPDGVTRLFLKNMCRKNMDEATLVEAVPGVTHIVWRTDRKTGHFIGSGWVEMATTEDAARAVGMNGKKVLGRPLYISYQPPDGKDAWPPPNSAIQQG